MSTDAAPTLGEPGTDPNADAYFLRSGGGSFHNIFPGVDIRTFAGERMMLSYVTIETDAIVREHSHPHEQMGVLISGRLEFRIGGATRLLDPGDMWRIPGGVVHEVRAVGGPAVAIDVFHPIRDDYR
ncbi:MAG: cupin domain-containing protein [Isosphaeraceae bacterium]|nr:cupin domain-containing protein [Isosphaeraceae bacterium]